MLSLGEKKKKNNCHPWKLESECTNGEINNINIVYTNTKSYLKKCSNGLMALK